MDMKAGSAGPQAGSPMDEAARKTVAIRRQLQVAGAELHLSNAALERHLPPGARQGDVAHALAQRGAIEEKVLEAADELWAVQELLHQGQAEWVRLRRELSEAVQRASQSSK